jgi:hypothetical protein
MTQIAAELDRMRFEIQKIRENLAKQQDMANAMAHVLIEDGVVPGVSDHCRCDECKLVAVSMAEAGYLDRVTDKWWEREREG